MRATFGRETFPCLLSRRAVLRLVPHGLVAWTTMAVAQDGGRAEVGLAEVQKPLAESPPDGTVLPALLDTSSRDGATALRGDWDRRRLELRKWWLGYLGLPELPRRPPPLRVLDQQRVGSVIRQRVSYASEEGWPTEAYLLKPVEAQGPLPAVAVFHSTVAHSIRQPAGVEGAPEKAFGLKLAERGFVAICPRNFLWPNNHQIDTTRQMRVFHDRHPSWKGMAKMLLDAMVAVDILAGLPIVDPQRIGAVGHSLGAKEVLYLAAFDERVKVTVSSEGGIGTRFSNWEAPWYLGPAINEPEFDHEHHELLAMIAPRPFLLVGGNSADGDRSWPFMDAALPIYRLYGGKPRLGLLNHNQGHAVTPQAEARIYEWFQAYL